LTREEKHSLAARTGHTVFVTFAALALGGCEAPALREDSVLARINADLAEAAQEKPKAAPPPAVSEALLPPLTVEVPAAAKPAESRFDLSVNNAPANQVFMAIVSGTRYSMLVHPDITEPVTITLKDVTLFEALDAMREVYGYEWKLDGTRIYVMPVSIQTRMFQVNYLAGRRVGRADVRVSSGSIQAPFRSKAAA
jgi:MSHA biogenesis protein MshL